MRMKIAHSSSFMFTVCFKSVPFYHFKLAFVVLHMAVEEFFETHFQNWRNRQFNLESFLTNLENQLRCTAEFVSRFIFCFNCTYNN